MNCELKIMSLLSEVSVYLLTLLLYNCTGNFLKLTF